jgi:predicted  nucleic acid-binding Zn-ribbon protein
MEQSAVSIEQFQDELQSWKRELSSTKEEIKSFEQELSDLAFKNHNREVLAHVEHFQNNFIRQKEVIDELRHDLPDSRYKVENIFNSRYQSPDEDHDVHAHLSDRMETFRKLYHELKDDFQRFETEYLV